MGVAKSIEQRLEGLVEGFFTKVFRSGLQPIEVGRRILREMGDNKTVSVNKVYVANDFRVLMGDEDHSRFAQMESGLVREFSDLVIDQAKQNRWNLMGMPRIVFQADPSMGRGEFRVEASLSADPDARAPRASTRESTGDPSSTGAIASSEARRLGLGGAAEVVVLDDDGEPKERITITGPHAVIGRMSSSDIVLSDPNVSRRHAELRKDNTGWMLVDLGSTNGTLVNGKLAKEHRIKDGDRLAFGTSELLFKTRS